MRKAQPHLAVIDAERSLDVLTTVSLTAARVLQYKTVEMFDAFGFRRSLILFFNPACALR